MDKFEPGLDSNNNNMFKKDREQHDTSLLVKQRESDEELVVRLLGDPTHEFIRMLRRNIEQLRLPEGTTTTEYALIRMGAMMIPDSLVEILEDHNNE